MQRSEVIEFLDKIDRHTAKNYRTLLGQAKFELRIIGKCALVLAGMVDSVGTVDLDSLRVEGGVSLEVNQDIVDGLLAEVGKPRQMIHGYYLDFVAPAMVFLPQRQKWIALEGDWSSLSVNYLERHQTIASKLFSAFSKPPRKKDRQDIGAALDQKVVGLQKVLDEADHIFDFHSMDARNDRFPDVFRYLNEELMPNYGGGRLRYRPQEE